ncbi:MAG: hypothetical protein KDD70_00530 [Bdellovibrionales bacterium]|nr:hypothetical protein [Bdellovibrionales bacterium]
MMRAPYRPRHTYSCLHACLFISLLSLLQGCSVLRARPADNAGFLPKPELVKEQRDRAPFNGYWVFNPVEYEVLRKEYGKAYIAPIDIEVVRKSYLHSGGSEERKLQRIEEAEELAKYWRESIILMLQEKSGDTHSFSPLKVVNEPGPGILTLRLALIEVTPTNPGVNIIGTAAGFLLPGAGFLKIAGEGSVAMEGFVHEVDPEVDTFEEYKDREGQKASFFSLKDYQQYAHIRSVIDDWSQQIVELLTTQHSVKVDDSNSVSLNPL